MDLTIASTIVTVPVPEAPHTPENIHSILCTSHANLIAPLPLPLNTVIPHPAQTPEIAPSTDLFPEIIAPNTTAHAQISGVLATVLAFFFFQKSQILQKLSSRSK